MRLVNEASQNVGVVVIAEAMRLANEANLDLVEVAPDADPPVCRIMDYGKHKYRLKKKQHQSHVKTHHVQLKQIRLSPVIEDHDIGVKVKQAKDFFSRGDRVTFNMMFRGRQMLHTDVGHQVMHRIEKELADVANSEGSPRMEGRRMWMTMAPKPASSSPAAPKAASAAKPAPIAPAAANPAAAASGTKSAAAVVPPAAVVTPEPPAAPAPQA